MIRDEAGMTREITHVCSFCTNFTTEHRRQNDNDRTTVTMTVTNKTWRRQRQCQCQRKRAHSTAHTTEMCEMRRDDFLFSVCRCCYKNVKDAPLVLHSNKRRITCIHLRLKRFRYIQYKKFIILAEPP